MHRGVLDIATGRVSGRTVQDVLSEAWAASARQDAADPRRVHRDGHGEPEKLHVEFGEPVIHEAKRSEHSLALFNQTRRFLDRLAAKRELDRAERAAELTAERSRNDVGILNNVHPRRRDAGWVS